MKTISIFKIFTLLLFFPLTVISQNQNNNSENNTTSSNDNFSSLMFNASYTNNNLEYLSGATEKIPLLYTNLAFTHKSGVYAGISYAKFFSETIPSTDYAIQTGYQNYFDNGFDIDLSYEWHKFDGDSILAGLNYNHSLDAMMGYEIGKLYFSTDLNYTLGKTNNFFFDLSLSRSIEFNKIFFKNDVLLINPSLSVSFGTDYWLYEDMTETEKSDLFTYLKQSGYAYNTFSYESFNIFLPVSYGIGDTYLTFSWLYKIPGNKYDAIGWEKQSGIMLSLTYFLNFNKK